MSFICQVDVFANKGLLDPDAIDHVRKASTEWDVSKPASLALQVSKGPSTNDTTLKISGEDN